MMGVVWVINKKGLILKKKGGFNLLDVDDVELV